MPKMKTNRAAAKRFSKTGTGKYRYNKSFRRHLLEHKNDKRMRRLAKPGIVKKCDEGRVKQLVPYL